MKKIFAVALMAAVCANAVAGNKSNNNAAAKAASDKQQTVYVYKSANAHGIWYHVDTKCALKCKEYAVVEGKAMGISVTKENNAKGMGMMACPTCGHKHAVCKNAVAER